MSLVGRQILIDSQIEVATGHLQYYFASGQDLLFGARLLYKAASPGNIYPE